MRFRSCPVLIFGQLEGLGEGVVQAIGAESRAVGLHNGLGHGGFDGVVEVVVVVHVFHQVNRVGSGGMGVDGVGDVPLADGVEDAAGAGEVFVVDPVLVGQGLGFVQIGGGDDLFRWHIDDGGGVGIAGAEVVQRRGFAADLEVQPVVKGAVDFGDVADGVEGEVGLAVTVADDFGVGEYAGAAGVVVMFVGEDDWGDRGVGDFGDFGLEGRGASVVAGVGNQDAGVADDYQAAGEKAEVMIDAVGQSGHCGRGYWHCRRRGWRRPDGGQRMAQGVQTNSRR